MAVLLALVTNRILALFDMPIWLAGASWKIIEDKKDEKSLFQNFKYIIPHANKHIKRVVKDMNNDMDPLSDEVNQAFNAFK